MTSSVCTRLHPLEGCKHVHSHGHSHSRVVYTVSNKTVPMFAHLAFMVLYLREYSSELHDPSFTGKPRIPPFRGHARHVITTGIRRDMLATLERQHRNGFVADASVLRTHPLSAHPIILVPAPSFLGRPQRLPLCSSCSLIGPRPGSKRFHSRSIVFPVWREIPTTVPCDSGPVLGRTRT